MEKFSILLGGWLMPSSMHQVLSLAIVALNSGKSFLAFHRTKIAI
jgi:hypothetical protein